MKEKDQRHDALPEKWDDWHVRLPDPKDQLRVIDLYRRSGAKSKSDFVRARILGKKFKVITVDKSAVDYHRKLSQLTSHVYKIGLNYNQVVKAINRRPELPQLKNAMGHISLHTKKLIGLMEEAISLTRDFRNK